MVHVQISLCAHHIATSVSTPHISSLQSTMSPGTMVYIHLTLLANAPEQKCLPHCAYVYHCTATVVNIDFYNLKSNKLNFNYHCISIYMPATNIPPHAIYMPYVQITQCVSIEEVFQYICNL